jgi:SAM-dependent methyltransferase
VRTSPLARGDSVGEDAPQFDVRMQCPRCRTDLTGLSCIQCGLRMRTSHGLVHALAPERAAHFARFIADYERIRAAEGRGSKSQEFYLGLPYEDITGRNQNQWNIRGRSYDCLIEQVLEASGRQRMILDIGAGNCWMSYRLALMGYRPVAVDLLTNEDDGLGAAVHYQEALPDLFPRFQAEISRLPFQSGQFDVVIFNASFHYSEDYKASLSEALRCLRSDGMVVISDTPWYSTEESGRKMVAERHAGFAQRYRTASDSIRSLEFLTDERLRELEEQLSIQWSVFSPQFGWKWAMRPIVARLRGKREPSRFRIYVARKDA